MDKNQLLKLTDVTSITSFYCSYVNGREYTSVTLPFEMDGKNYYSVFVCDKDDVLELEEKFQAKPSIEIKEIYDNEKYCPITTYEARYKKYWNISFDKENYYPVQASFNSHYQQIESFFRSFIAFRQSLIDSNQIVKEDDIFQYFCSSVTGFEERKTPKKNKMFVKSKKNVDK